MPGYGHGWLLAQGRDGESYEIINQARTAAYLSNPSLSLDDVSICDILAFGGCQTYAYGPETVVASAGYIDFPGTPSGNYAWIPSGGIPSGGADMTVVAQVAADDWTPAAIQTLVARWNTVTGGRSWSFELITTGALRWNTSVDGAATTTTHTSSALLSALANGARQWIAVTFRANNGAAGRSTRFWTSTDGTTWTELGTVQTTAGTTTLYATTTPTTIGAQAAGTSQLFAGNVYDLSIRTGTGAAGVVGGTEVFGYDGDRDLVGAPSGGTVFVATTGEAVTVAGAATRLYAPTTRCDLVSQTYANPSGDPAPWYNANYPESAGALGFYVDEWTGLDDGHVRRPTTTVGLAGGGAQLGVITAEGRTMALNVLLFARSEAAMDYLFRWLSSTLNSVCSTCATDTVLIRRFCGTTADPWDGVVELRRVGVVQGLKWESEVGVRSRCYIRRASFTLMAGDPCMYLPNETVATSAQNYDANLVSYFTAKPTDATRTICRPSCGEVTTAGRTSRTFTVAPLGAMAPVVTWTNTSTTNHTYPFRAMVYFGERETDAPSPCGMPILGELYVRALPPSSAMRWDITGRRVEFRDSSTGGWAETWVYVDANDPPQRRFFALPCGTAHLVMEPATMCAEFVSGTEWELDGITFDPPAYPTVALEMSERLSCP